MTDVTEFLNAVDEIDREQPRYRLGGTAQDGTCDCIGLVAGALERAGGRWTGICGTNWTARYKMKERFPAKKEKLERGMLVFKSRKSTEKLPARYKKGGSAYNGDTTDYYHVGVVREINPLLIVHCTTPTVKHAGSLSGWSWAGWPDFLEEDEAESACRCGCECCAGKEST